MGKNLWEHKRSLEVSEREKRGGFCVEPALPGLGCGADSRQAFLWGISISVMVPVGACKV